MAQSNLARVLLDEALERGRGEAPALREPKRIWTWAKLAEEAERAANALRELSIRPGERVALLLHDSAEWAATFLGALRMGAVPVPLSVLVRPLDVRNILGDAEACAVVTSADLAPNIDAVRGELPSLRRLLAVGGARAGHEDFHAITREVEPGGPVYEPPDGAPAFLLYSAGTSGAPRGVPHDHHAPRAAHAAYARAVLGLGDHDRVFTTASLASAYGLGLGLLFALEAGACTFLLPTRPRPRVVFDVLQTFRPTVFAATPSLYGQMVRDFRELPSPRPPCFESVRHAVSGAEGLPPALAQRVKATFGVQPLHGYGVTEGLHFVLSNRPGQSREGSAGQPLDGIEARIVDDAGNPLGPHEIGSLELRGPTVARGYFRHRPEHAGVFHASGWLRPGDRFFVDGDGHFFHCGRADDRFKVGGRWIQPDEVERTLLGHPAVWECAVVEGHDEDGLALPVAFVVPNVGQTPSPELAKELTEHVKREIAPYKYPREVLFVTELPKDTDGRVLRWRLRRASARGR